MGISPLKVISMYQLIKMIQANTELCASMELGVSGQWVIPCWSAGHASPATSTTLILVQRPTGSSAKCFCFFPTFPLATPSRQMFVRSDGWCSIRSTSNFKAEMRDVVESVWGRSGKKKEQEWAFSQHPLNWWSKSIYRRMFFLHLATRIHRLS